jgi:hypothetical protein
MPDSHNSRYLSPVLSCVQEYGADPTSEDIMRIDAETAIAEAQPATAERPYGIMLAGLAVALLALAALSLYNGYRQQAALQELTEGLAKLSRQSAAPVVAEPHSHPDNPLLGQLETRLDIIQQQLALLAGQVDELATPPAPVAAPQPVMVSAPADTAQAPGDGEWYINLAAFRSELAARGVATSLDGSPRPVVVAPVTTDNGTFYRVSTGGFADAEQARSWIPRLQERWNLKGLWVSGQ